MPIKANNIVVGGVNPPTTEKKTEPVSYQTFSSFQDVRAQANVQSKLKKKNLNTVIEQKQRKELPKYVAKEDGVLVRKINSKSDYMRDIYELDS